MDKIEVEVVAKESSDFRKVIPKAMAADENIEELLKKHTIGSFKVEDAK